MDPVISAAGFAVGLLVGLTGMGGGSLLTPLLWVLGIPVPMAIGTDLAYNVGTKAVGTWIHGRQGTVDWRWAGVLAAGGVPMAVAGSVVGGLLGHDAAHLLRSLLGATLVVAGLGSAGSRWVRRRLGVRRQAEHAEAASEGSAASEAPRSGGCGRWQWRWVLVGAAVGLLVGLTSVGAGSLLTPVLLGTARLDPRKLVGIDMAYGLAVTTAAGLAHVVAGTADLALAAQLALGSVPGVWIGSRLMAYVPKRPLHLALSGLVVISGVTMW
ncbi:MAG: sulfite exporter TauE/SafE family protein [Firmicutes bacterium]|nr:sulfite exporter TauE/SafE family protein [Alicyclobacillaceae bacterium]MCL6497179.1 sulfite exporter TauE/SafE family protein [Bacillota bacterium]